MKNLKFNAAKRVSGEKNYRQVVAAYPSDILSFTMLEKCTIFCSNR